MNNELDMFAFVCVIPKQFYKQEMLFCTLLFCSFFFLFVFCFIIGFLEKWVSSILFGG